LRRFTTGVIRLYYWDAKKGHRRNEEENAQVALLTTVIDKKNEYSSRDVANADKA